jgi:hypothetical protein
LVLARQRYAEDKDAYLAAVAEKRKALIALKHAEEDLKETVKKGEEEKRNAIKRTSSAAKHAGWMLHETFRKIQLNMFSTGTQHHIAARYQREITQDATNAFGQLDRIAKQYGVTLNYNNLSFTQAIDLLKKKIGLATEYRGKIDEIINSAKTMSESIEEWKGGVDTIKNLRDRFDSLIVKIQGLTDKSNGLNSLLNDAISSSADKMFHTFINGADILYKKINELRNELASSGGEATKNIDEIMEAYSELNEVGAAYVEALKSEFMSLEGVQNEVTDSILDIRNAYKELADEFANSDFNGVVSNFSFLYGGITSNTELADSFKEIGNAIDDMYKKIKTVFPELKSDYMAATNEINKLIISHSSLSTTSVEDVTTLKETIVESYTEMFASIKEKIEGMKSLWDSLKEKVIEITDKIKEVQQGTDDIILELRKKTMSEEEKYNADRKRFEELITKAKEAEGKKQYDIAEKYYQQATEIAKSLAVEVTDINGEVILSLEDSIEKSIKMIEMVSNRYTDMLKKQRAEVNEQAKAAESSLNSILNLAETASKTYEDKLIYAQNLIIAKQKEFTDEIFRTNEAIRELVALLDQQFKGKTPTSIFDEGPKSRQFAEGGHVNVPGAPTNRDTIPAVLSNHEFVMQSKAVRKYGTGFFNALNNMTIPSDIMAGLTSGLSKMKDGISGYLKGGFVKPQFGFASGGLVGSNTTNNSTANNYYSGNFTINGAGKQAKEIAIEVDKILTDRARYNRSSFYKMVR